METHGYAPWAHLEESLAERLPIKHRASSIQHREATSPTDLLGSDSDDYTASKMSYDPRRLRLGPPHGRPMPASGYWMPSICLDQH